MNATIDGMTWLDATLLSGLLLGAVLGGRSGAVRQIARIAGFAAAVAVSLGFHVQTAEWLTSRFPDIPLRAAAVLSYTLPFLGIWLAGLLITHIVEKLTAAARLSVANRAMGAGLGTAKHGLFITAALMGVNLIPDARVQETLQNSRVAQSMLSLGDSVAAAVPQQYKDELAGALQRAKAAGIEEAGKLAGAAARELAAGLDKAVPVPLSDSPTSPLNGRDMQNVARPGPLGELPLPDLLDAIR